MKKEWAAANEGIEKWRIRKGVRKAWVIREEVRIGKGEGVEGMGKSSDGTVSGCSEGW